VSALEVLWKAEKSSALWRRNFISSEGTEFLSVLGGLLRDVGVVSDIGGNDEWVIYRCPTRATAEAALEAAAVAMVTVPRLTGRLDADILRVVWDEFGGQMSVLSATPINRSLDLTGSHGELQWALMSRLTTIDSTYLSSTTDEYSGGLSANIRQYLDFGGRFHDLFGRKQGKPQHVANQRALRRVTLVSNDVNRQLQLLVPYFR